jgi:hypothetical protein
MAQPFTVRLPDRPDVPKGPVKIAQRQTLGPME